MGAADLTTARAAKRHLAARLKGQPNINGVGVAPAPGGWTLKVNLVDPDPRPQVPRIVDGVDVLVEVVGRGFKQPA